MVGREALRKYAASSDSSTEDEDEDEDDDEDGIADDQILKKTATKQRSFADGSGSLGQVKWKRSRPSMKIETETNLPNADDEMNGTRTGFLVEGYIVKRHGHYWHKAGTKSGRTYVSKRRPVIEVEKGKTLEKARQVQISHPSFLKQLHKDSCYLSLNSLQLHSTGTTWSLQRKDCTKAKLIDQQGKTWSTRIMGMKIFWKHFTLDHYLEEDYVVVFELLDPSPGSVIYIVHIFRVVDVKVTLSGKEGWAVPYNVVEGTKKKYFEERRRLLKAQGQKKL